MEADIAIAVAIAMVVAFIAAQVGRTVRARAVQRTLREAVSRGVPISPELFVEADRTAAPGANDQRNGMVLVALALAIALFGVIEGGTSVREMLSISLFPLFVGIALLLRVRLARKQGDA